MATIELCSGCSLGTGFQLHIRLAEIHVPRMWVEETNSSGPNVRMIIRECVYNSQGGHCFVGLYADILPRV